MNGKFWKTVLLALLVICASEAAYAQYYSDELVLKAEAGDIGSQIELGYCYYAGEGVAQDYAKAVKWWQKAAEAGDEMAQFNMSLCYSKGDGVPQDPAKAIVWLRKSAEQGFPEAQYNLALCYANGVGVEQGLEEAIEWYRKAADQGLKEALFNLGYCYYNGDGVEQDYDEAIEWYRKAADQGLKEALFNLGYCYYNGDGVEQDYAAALEWWCKAAEQDDAKSQFYIGLCYLYGDGVEKNEAEALDWFTYSAILGYPEAMAMIEALEPEEADDEAVAVEVPMMDDDMAVEVMDDDVEEMEAVEETESKSLNDIRFAGWTDKDWLNNDYIRELRKYIDAYNRGEIENPELDEYKEILKGKFVIGDIQPFIMGGVFIHFIFIDYPQVCFETGVYSDVDEERETVTGYHVIDVRCIGDDMDWMSKEEILETMEEHPELIAW